MNTAGGPSSKYDWPSALLRNLRNVSICMEQNNSFCKLRIWKDLSKIGYLHLSCAFRLSCMSFSKNKFSLLSQNSVTDVSVGFRPPCWRSSSWAPAWLASPQIACIASVSARVRRESWDESKKKEWEGRGKGANDPQRTSAGRLQHGVSIQISIILGKTFLPISRIRNIPLTWILARVFVYVSPFISQILDFIYWTVLSFILIYFEWRDTEKQQ